MTTSEAGRPNFFIIGAPKCGTTAMSRYLADHPDIHMSKRKELHFFNDDLHDPIVRRPWSSEVQYLKEFDAPSGTRIVGEASVFYAYSDVAVSRIREFDTQAKIAFMVRNPVDLVHSFHSQLLFSGQETLRDLRDAWEKRDSREGSALLKYGEVARLGSSRSGNRLRRHASLPGCPTRRKGRLSCRECEPGVSLAGSAQDSATATKSLRLETIPRYQTVWDIRPDRRDQLQAIRTPTNALRYSD